MQAFWAGVQREWQRLLQQPSYWVALIVLPALAIVLTFSIVAHPSVTSVPLDIVDMDKTAASRDIIFRLDASSAADIARVVNTPDEALTRAQRKESFGYLIIPEGFHQKLVTGQTVSLDAFINQQSYMLGNVLSNQLLRNLMEKSLSESALHLMTGGQIKEQALANVYPLQMTRSVMGNSYLNYQSFLLASMLPHIWHVLVMLITVIAIGKEFKDGTVQQWYETSNHHLSLAITSKLLIPGVVMAAWIAIIQILNYQMAGVGTGQGLKGLILASWLTQFSYHCAGLLVVAFTHNYRVSLSVAAFYTTPAFAFVGVTFPTFNMNWISQLWQTLLPVTVLLDVQNQFIHWQKSLWDVWPDLILVAVFALTYGGLAMLILRPKLTDSNYWYRH